MADSISTALIGAGGTVVGALITAGVSIISKVYSGRGRLYSSTRLDSIAGTWSGGGEDSFVEEDKPTVAFKLTVSFRRSGRKVSATGDLTSAANPAQNTTVVLEGGFFSDDYLQFNYRSQDQGRRQMGVIVFRLSGDARNIAGHYAGLSPWRGVFVMGHVSLSKIASA